MPSVVADGSVHFGQAFLGERKPWHFPSMAIVAENFPLPVASTGMSKRCPGENRAPLGGVIVTTASADAAPATQAAVDPLRPWPLFVSASHRVPPPLSPG